jgi:hypothetical protein
VRQSAGHVPYEKCCPKWTISSCGHGAGRLVAGRGANDNPKSGSKPRDVWWQVATFSARLGSILLIINGLDRSTLRQRYLWQFWVRNVLLALPIFWLCGWVKIGVWLAL